MNQRDIGKLEGCVIAIDMMRINLIEFSSIMNVLNDCSISMDEMKKYCPETLETWEERDDGSGIGGPSWDWSVVKQNLINNNRKVKL